MALNGGMEVFKFKPKKQPKVIRRKLGKEQAWGRFGDMLIEVDIRLTGKKELIIYLHEYFHYLLPELSEDEVIIKSESLADFMWSLGYRKVDNKE